MRDIITDVKENGLYNNINIFDIMICTPHQFRMTITIQLVNQIKFGQSILTSLNVYQHPCRQTNWVNTVQYLLTYLILI